MRQQLALCVATLILVLLWFRRPVTTAVPRRPCAELEVCSHQASGVDVDRVNGSLAAFRALWQNGVHCYDMDVTALADALLVTHPARLQAAIRADEEVLVLSTIDLASVRRRGGDDDSFPTILQFLETTRTLLDGTPSAKDSALIMLDLKPPAQAPHTIAAIAADVRSLQLGDRVALYTLPGESHLARHWKSGPCICGYKDRNIVTGAKYHHVVSRRNTAHCKFLGPSIWLPDAFFKDARASRKPMYSWVIDDVDMLRRGQDQGVQAAISNRPLTLLRLLKSEIASCH